MDKVDPGDLVWFDGYGTGKVMSIDAHRLVVNWSRAGVLDHAATFTRWLKPADSQQETRLVAGSGELEQVARDHCPERLE